MSTTNDFNTIFGLGAISTKKVNDAPTVKSQKENIIESLKSDETINTPQKLFAALYAINYAIVPSRKLFTEFFGDVGGKNVHNRIKTMVDGFVTACMLYTAEKSTAGGEVNKQRKSALIERAKFILATLSGAEESDIGKVKLSMFDDIVKLAYACGYRDRGNITEGYTFKAVGTYKFIGDFMKFMSASDTMAEAAEKASIKYGKYLYKEYCKD